MRLNKKTNSESLLHWFSSKVTWLSDYVLLPPAAQTDAAYIGSSPWPREPFQNERSGAWMWVERPAWKDLCCLMGYVHHFHTGAVILKKLHQCTDTLALHLCDTAAKSLKITVSSYVRILRLACFQFFPKSMKNSTVVTGCCNSNTVLSWQTKNAIFFPKGQRMNKYTGKYLEQSYAPLSFLLLFLHPPL